MSLSNTYCYNPNQPQCWIVSNGRLVSFFRRNVSMVFYDLNHFKANSLGQKSLLFGILSLSCYAASAKFVDVPCNNFFYDNKVLLREGRNRPEGCLAGRAGV